MHFYCMCRLTFIKSYDSGHSMPTVAKGLLSGEELLRHFSSGGKKKKVYFLFEESGMTVGSASCHDCFSTSVCMQRDLFHLFQLFFSRICSCFLSSGRLVGVVA